MNKFQMRQQNSESLTIFFSGILFGVVPEYEDAIRICKMMSGYMKISAWMLLSATFECRQINELIKWSWKSMAAGRYSTIFMYE